MSSVVSKGSCQCGSIKFTLNGPPDRTLVCYCDDCRKGSGHLGQMTAFYKTTDVNIIDDESNLKQFVVTKTQSGHPKHKEFCSNCGSTIRTLPMKYNGEVSVVRASLLDDNFKICAPKIAIFTDTKDKYVEGIESDYF